MNTKQKQFIARTLETFGKVISQKNTSNANGPLGIAMAVEWPSFFSENMFTFTRDYNMHKKLSETVSERRDARRAFIQHFIDLGFAGVQPTDVEFIGFRCIGDSDAIECVYLETGVDVSTIVFRTASRNLWNSFTSEVERNFTPTLRFTNIVPGTNDTHVSRLVSVMDAEVRPVYPEFYPNIPNLDTIFDNFIKASANALILMGEPGTGKTTWLRHCLARTDRKVVMANGEAAIRSAMMLQTLQQPNGKIAIMEDADSTLLPRTEGNNNHMSGLLNALDGVVMNNNKVIISTNLSTLKNVDTALLRPGRLYGVLKFGALKPEQAIAARRVVGLPDVELGEKDLTLAQALNFHSENMAASSELHPSIQRFGF